MSEQKPENLNAVLRQRRKAEASANNTHQESASPRPPAYRRPNGLLTQALQIAISRMPAGSKIRESVALAYWPQAVGQQAAAATEADSVRDGILFINTKSSVWSHELTLHKQTILENLNGMLGEKLILDIVFRAKGVGKQEPIRTPEMPSMEELAQTLLSPEEQNDLQKRKRNLASISDEKIRSAIIKRMEHNALLRRWRLNHGWHPCQNCGALHFTEYDICPTCRTGSDG